MKVTIGDRVYLVEFSYAVVFNPRGRKTDMVSCTIRDGSALRGPQTPAPILAVGYANRHFKDAPNREVGRKAALANALFSMPYSVFPHSLAKSMRAMFWTVYLNRKKKPATKMDVLIAELAVQEMVHSTKP